MRFRVLPGIAALVFFAIGTAAGVEVFAVEAALSADEAPTRSSPQIAAGTSALQIRTNELISSSSRIAMEQVASEDARKVVLESASFSRSRGIVSGAGVFWDGKGPRSIKLFLDAYGEGPVPLASFPFDFQSTGQRQTISVSANDMPDFERFAFRFTANGENLRLSSPGDATPSVAAVSSSAILFHSDYGELRHLLDGLGYIESDSFEPIAMLGAISRFRQDNSLTGPSFVTLGDLFAARLVSGQLNGPTSMLPYVEWASALSGGREIQRRSLRDVRPPAPDRSTSSETSQAPMEEAFFLD